ncbi:hypothetical protein FXN61_36905 [Lentzea sp. PSKA42]|uniref:Uncharacterized protein n=2 Tax=Lentzea indica TaxID=2604800 RepID=A0ABX1FTT9_9PSEU|nr:hypothetical protein [Lentzea indica]
MRIPAGTDVVRLVPFTEDNISAWLKVWNASNVGYFKQQGIAPLAAETVMAHHDLAVQPLLLLMLALYDAADNALQRHQDSLGRAGLYEKLLYRFASREINKGAVPTSEDTRTPDRHVELELERLSVVAFAMFRRGAQWITASDLDDDLQALLGATQPKPYGMRKPLSDADRIVGRFFFVQCAKAIREEETLRTYEFLHATFGEYLVVRFTWRILNDLHVSESSRYHRVSGAQPDDSHLHALLSLTPLTSSNSVIDFLITRGGDVRERGSVRITATWSCPWAASAMRSAPQRPRSTRRSRQQPSTGLAVLSAARVDRQAATPTRSQPVLLLRTGVVRCPSRMNVLRLSSHGLRALCTVNAYRAPQFPPRHVDRGRHSQRQHAARVGSPERKCLGQ